VSNECGTVALVHAYAALATAAGGATEAEGWLARTMESFPEQLVGRRFAVRGTHLTDAPTPGRLVEQEVI
jgi:hypothetical protein